MTIAEILTCRRVLHIMVNSEFIMNTMLKAVFNIAIVAMVKKKDQPNTSHLFFWSEDQKQEILGIFFWGFALTKIVSGRLAEIIGSRKVSGYSMALASLLTICTPTIAYWNYYVLLMSRVVVGFLIGATWPAVMPLASKWIPPQDHSVFISCLASTAIGAALAYHLHGVLIDAYGWASVFYITGSMGLLWSLVWFYLVYDSPNQHPRISQREKQTIESEIEVNNAKPKQFNQIPWKQIAKSGPVWAITAGQVATFLGYTTCLNEMPSYLDQVLHLNIKQNGFFSGFPYWGLRNRDYLYRKLVNSFQGVTVRHWVLDI
jgi:ACS family sodium-dependent inorganic phosphate cotransporter